MNSNHNLSTGSHKRFWLFQGFLLAVTEGSFQVVKGAGSSFTHKYIFVFKFTHSFIGEYYMKYR